MRENKVNLHCVIKHAYASVINFVEVKQKLYFFDNNKTKEFSEKEQEFYKIVEILNESYFKNKKLNNNDILFLSNKLREIRSYLENIIKEVLNKNKIKDREIKQLVENSLLDDFVFLVGNIINMEIHLNYCLNDDKYELDEDIERI